MAALEYGLRDPAAAAAEDDAEAAAAAAALPASATGKVEYIWLVRTV